MSLTFTHQHSLEHMSEPLGASVFPSVKQEATRKHLGQSAAITKALPQCSQYTASDCSTFPTRREMEQPRSLPTPSLGSSNQEPAQTRSHAPGHSPPSSLSSTPTSVHPQCQAHEGQQTPFHPPIYFHARHRAWLTEAYKYLMMDGWTAYF